MDQTGRLKILLYGSREFAEVVHNLCIHCNYEVMGCIDDFQPGNMDAQPRILGPFNQITTTYPPAEYAIAIAIGYRHLRERFQIFEAVKKAGYRVPNLIHPRAYLDPAAQLGEGVMVMANATVELSAQVGDLGVIWPGAVVNHNATLGPNVFVSPNATLCGHCSVGANSFLGAGSIVVDHTALPAWTRVKAGERAYIRVPQ